MAEELTFQGENSNEQVLFAIHRHPWTLIKPGLIIVILLLIATAIFFKFQASSITSWTIFLLLPICFYLAAHAWFIWTNSVYMVTTDRILTVDQRGWFDRQVDELSLVDIMKIGHEVKGAWATLMNFGDVNVIASGATETDLTLRAIYDPYEIQQRIIRAKKDHQAAANS